LKLEIQPLILVVARVISTTVLTAKPLVVSASKRLQKWRFLTLEFSQ
jgi:hypothetical protein